MRASDLTKCGTIKDTDKACGYDYDLAVAYVAGLCLPHYPVPAIRLEVDICETWANTITIFTERNGYQYEIGEQWS